MARRPETRLCDTSPEAERVYLEALRGLGAAGRVRVMFEWSDQIRRVMESGIRQRHPEYTEEQVRQARNRLIWGDVLFQEVYPGVEIEP